MQESSSRSNADTQQGNDAGRPLQFTATKRKDLHMGSPAPGHLTTGHGPTNEWVASQAIPWHGPSLRLKHVSHWCCPCRNGKHCTCSWHMPLPVQLLCHRCYHFRFRGIRNSTKPASIKTPRAEPRKTTNKQESKQKCTISSIHQHLLEATDYYTSSLNINACRWCRGWLMPQHTRGELRVVWSRVGDRSTTPTS